jgi:hypothetical protein
MTTIDEEVPCAYCKRTGVPMKMIDSVPTNSGPGFPVFACRDCLAAAGADVPAELQQREAS